MPLRGMARKPPPWRRYYVGIDGDISAGNLPHCFAMHYAEGQASFGRTAVVMKMQRDGTLRVVKEIVRV